MQARTKFITTIVAVLVVVVLATAAIMGDPTFVSAYEGQDTRLVNYTAANYDPARGTDLDLSDTPTRAFIDPDGTIVMGTLFPKAGQVTGLQIGLSQPVPINYISGKYSQVYSNAQWRPTDEWEVTINGVEHKICVYRMVFGLTITTTTNRPEKGTEEHHAIQNLKINVRVHLPTWRGVEDAFVGLGNIRIPRTTEVAGTNWDPPVNTELVSIKQRSSWARLLDLGIQFNHDPYIAPYSPGVFLYGTDVKAGTNPVGAPVEVTIPFEWASIAPGIEDIGVLAEQRVELSEALKVVFTFMAARPLYVTGDEGGTGTGVGGVVQPPLVCGFLEDPVYASDGKTVEACMPKDILGDIKFLAILAIIGILGVVFVALIIRSLLGRRK